MDVKVSTMAMEQQQSSESSSNGTGAFLNSNCSFQQSMESLRHPLPISIATLGIFANILVILVIRHTMHRRQTQAQIHLMALAFCDIAVTSLALYFVPISWKCNLCLPFNEARRCYIAFIVGGLLWLFALGMNKYMTLYITFVRAKAIYNFKYALKSSAERVGRFPRGYKHTSIRMNHYLKPQLVVPVKPRIIPTAGEALLAHVLGLFFFLPITRGVSCSI